MERFVLDTNIFFNMEAGLNLGKRSLDVVKKITQLAKILKKEKKGEFLMTPKAVDEFLSFFEDKNQEFIKDFLSSVTIQSPDLSKISFSSVVFYQLINEVRQRAYRGLNIAEEEIEEAAKAFLNKKIDSKKDFQIKIGEFIRRFRERYRKATREGFLDSVVDLELIILAKEKDAFLVSTDEGVCRWADIFAVKRMPALVFAKRLELVLPSHLAEDQKKNQ